MSCAMQCVISIDQLNCPFKTNYTYGSFCKEKKRSHALIKKLRSALFASYVHNLAVEIKGIQNVRYSILQKNYNPKSSVSVTLQYDKIMNITVWICC